MKRIDLVGASACRHVSNKACVTVAIDTFKMERTLFHGDFVRLEAIVNRTGKSSLVTQADRYCPTLMSPRDLISGSSRSARIVMILRLRNFNSHVMPYLHSLPSTRMGSQRTAFL